MQGKLRCKLYGIFVLGPKPKGLKGSRGVPKDPEK